MNSKGTFTLTAAVTVIGSLLAIGMSAPPQQAQAREDKYCFLVILPPRDGGESTPDNVPTEMCEFKHKNDCEQARLALIDNENTEVLSAECYKQKIQNENDD
jgi:hypothetical protein